MAYIGPSGSSEATSIADGTIVNADINASAAIATSKITGLATSATTDTTNASNIATGTLPIARIADDAITLAKMASGTDGEIITYDASGNPATVSVGTSGHVLTSGGTGVAPTFQAAAGGGKVLQVVQATSNTQTTTGTTYASIDADVTITPSATTSKILLMFSTGGQSYGNINSIRLRIKRGSTVIRLIPSYGKTNDLGNGIHIPIAVTYLDSPSTTSSVTYTVEMATQDNSSVNVNDQSNLTGVNSLSAIAMEIGA